MSSDERMTTPPMTRSCCTAISTVAVFRGLANCVRESPHKRIKLAYGRGGGVGRGRGVGVVRGGTVTVGVGDGGGVVVGVAVAVGVAVGVAVAVAVGVGVGLTPQGLTGQLKISMSPAGVAGS